MQVYLRDGRPKEQILHGQIPVQAHWWRFKPCTSRPSRPSVLGGEASSPTAQTASSQGNLGQVPKLFFFLTWVSFPYGRQNQTTTTTTKTQPQYPRLVQEDQVVWLHTVAKLIFTDSKISICGHSLRCLEQLSIPRDCRRLVISSSAFPARFLGFTIFGGWHFCESGRLF